MNPKLWSFAVAGLAFGLSGCTDRSLTHPSAAVAESPTSKANVGIIACGRRGALDDVVVVIEGRAYPASIGEHLDPQHIESIEILKGDHAMREWRHEGAILIKLNVPLDSLHIGFPSFAANES